MSIKSRLERLEAARVGEGPEVSILFPCADGTWDLTCHMGSGEIRQSNHRTMDEARAAYDALLKPGKSDPVLIIDDL